MTLNGRQQLPPRTSRLRDLQNLLLVLLLGTLGLLAVVWATGGRPNFGAIKVIKLPYLLACLGLVLLDWLSEGLRLWLLSRALGETVGFWSVMRIVLLGAFFARITPFDSGGEPFQVYALHRNGVPLGHATAVIAIKALLHGTARVCLGILVPLWLLVTAKGWNLGPRATIALYVGLGVYLGITLLLGLLFFGRARARAFAGMLIRKPFVARILARPRIAAVMVKLEQHAQSFVAAIRHFGRERLRTVALVGALSFAGWSAVLCVPVVLVRSLGGASPIAEIGATAVIFYLAVAYAPTPGSAGASEVGFAALFARFVPLPLVGVLVLVWRLMTHYLSLVLGFVVTAFGAGATRKGSAAAGHPEEAGADNGERALGPPQGLPPS